GPAQRPRQCGRVDATAADGDAFSVQDSRHASDRQPSPAHLANAAKDALLGLAGNEARALGPVADRGIPAEALPATALDRESGPSPATNNRPLVARKRVHEVPHEHALRSV